MGRGFKMIHQCLKFYGIISENNICCSQLLKSNNNNNNVVILEILLQINDLHRLQNSSTKDCKEFYIVFYQQPQQNFRFPIFLQPTVPIRLHKTQSSSFYNISQMWYLFFPSYLKNLTLPCFRNVQENYYCLVSGYGNINLFVQKSYVFY
jgi:hypothetical protein